MALLHRSLFFKKWLKSVSPSDNCLAGHPQAAVCGRRAARCWPWGCRHRKAPPRSAPSGRPADTSPVRPCTLPAPCYCWGGPVSIPEPCWSDARHAVGVADGRVPPTRKRRRVPQRRPSAVGAERAGERRMTSERAPGQALGTSGVTGWRSRLGGSANGPPGGPPRD